MNSLIAILGAISVLSTAQSLSTEADGTTTASVRVLAFVSATSTGGSTSDPDGGVITYQTVFDGETYLITVAL